MSTLLLGSEIFRDLFGTEAMRAVFSDRGLVQRYLDVEAALARVQARLGLIPEAAAVEITAKADVANIDFTRMKARTELVGYPILPLVEQLVALCRDGLGEYCHWGATTQDIMDTADVLQIRDGLALVEDDLDAIAARLAALAARYRETPMAGRTHLQHALPITFGTSARFGCPPSTATARGSTRPALACWSASSPVPPARSPRWARTAWRCTRR